MSAGRLVRVVDGDTVVVRLFGLFGPYNTPIRLSAIDAPELGQPGGVAAAQALRAFLSTALPRNTVYVTVRGVDRYGRLIGDVAIRTYCPTIRNPLRICLLDAGTFMVRNGYAWAIPRYGAGPNLLTLWRRARRRRVGIWRRRRPVRPSTWRRRRRRKRRIRAQPIQEHTDGKDKQVSMVNLVQSILM
jgi:endonuclease YncB( thermonuclease family)